jgi:hypothetical protein
LLSKRHCCLGGQRQRFFHQFCCGGAERRNFCVFSTPMRSECYCGQDSGNPVEIGATKELGLRIWDAGFRPRLFWAQPKNKESYSIDKLDAADIPVRFDRAISVRSLTQQKLTFRSFTNNNLIGEPLPSITKMTALSFL